MSQSPDTQPLSSCTKCGASIYPEHLARNLAGHWAGKPYCKVCLEEAINQDSQAGMEVDEVPTEAAEIEASAQVRTFHARLDDNALVQMDDQINAWLTRNPHVQVKLANSTVGTFEGRQAGPHLIMSLFYGVQSQEG